MPREYGGCRMSEICDAYQIYSHTGLAVLVEVANQCWYA